MFWYRNSYYKLSLKNIFKYFLNLTTKYHFISAIFGFFLFLVIISQLLSGTMLSFSLIPESMMIPVVRDEEDLEDLYTDDFFWLHERGVDFVFIVIYLHMLRKLYLNVFYFEQGFAWKSGVFSFLILHGVTFFGLVLCCTHLSDVTLTIAANIMHTFLFYFKGKAYWWLFTDKNLNTDTIIRLAYIHYVLAFYVLFLSFFHAIDMHYDWKHDVNFDGLDSEILWWDEAFSNELSSMLDFICVVFIICLYLYSEPEALSYEIFMWGDIGLVNDVRFYGVAPHWYFRPYMAWLLICPMHITGVFGIILYLFTLYHQPTISGNKEVFLFKNSAFQKKTNFFISNNNNSNSIDINFTSQFLFFVFAMCLLYCTTFLPSGRYYQRVYGNNGALFSFFYIFVYLAFYNTDRPNILNHYDIYNDYRTIESNHINIK